MEVNGASELLCFTHSSEYLTLCSAWAALGRGKQVLQHPQEKPMHPNSTPIKNLIQ